MRVQYASGRENLCALNLTTIAGSLTAGTYYFWLQGRNDVGYNLPGPVSQVAVNGSQGIQLTIPSAAYIEGENWHQYTVLISQTNDVTNSKLLLVFDRESLVLPYSLDLTIPSNLATEEQVAALPLSAINGKVLNQVSDGLVYYYNSFSSLWNRHYDGYNLGTIDDTTDIGLGCDTPVSLIDNTRYVINYSYALNGSKGKSRKYWVYNDQPSPVVLEKGRQVGITASIQEFDLSSLFFNLLKVVFEGYFDRTTEEFIFLQDNVADFSYLNVEIPYTENMENLILERNLESNQAFQFSVFPEFDISELGLGLNLAPVASIIGLTPFLVPRGGRATDLGELLGDVIIGTDPNLRRVYPTTGLSAFVDTGISVINGQIAKTRTPTNVLNLAPNQANQVVAINSGGNVYPVTTALRGNERQRALVSTLAGTTAASIFTTQAEGNANPNLSVTVDYPSIIRSTYPDVIAGSNKATFNADEVLVYVRKRNTLDGAIVETRLAQGLTPTNTTQDIFSFLYEELVLFAGTIPSSTFSFFEPSLTSAQVDVQNTTGGFFYDFALAFRYNGNTVTDISHSTLDGNVYELIYNLAEIGESLENLEQAVASFEGRIDTLEDLTTNSNFWGLNVDTRDDLKALASVDLFPKRSYSVTTAFGGLPAIYIYLPDSTRADDDDIYLKATNGPGNFVKISGGSSGSVPANAITDASGEPLTDGSGTILTF